MGRLFAALLALFEIKAGIGIGVRVAALAGPVLEIMDERIEVALCYIRIGLNVMLGVEQAGFSYCFIIAKKRFHSGPCTASTRNADGTGRSWSYRERALRVSRR